MKITPNSQVTTELKITSEKGDVFVDTSVNKQPVVYQSGQGQMIPAVEAKLMDMAEGETFSFTLEADDAFGQRQEGANKEVPKTVFENPDQLQEGMPVTAVSNDQAVFVTVVKINEETVELDLNHPLAGQRVTVEGTIVKVEDQPAH